MASSFNRVATVALKNPEGVILCRKYLERLVAETLKRNPEYVSLPMGIISVLGSDDRNFRKLYTDWLIHLFENNEDKDAITRWQPHWGPENTKLEHIDVSTLDQYGNGVYLWPKPYLLEQVMETEEMDGRPKMLLWILCTNSDKNSQVLDGFCASASSNIVTFMETENIKILDFLEDVNYGSSSSETSFLGASVALLLLSTWSKETVNASWEQLFNEIDKKPLQPRQFDGEDLTLSTFVRFLETLKENVDIRPGVQTPDENDNSQQSHYTSPQMTSATTRSNAISSPGHQIMAPTKVEMVTDELDSSHVTEQSDFEEGQAVTEIMHWIENQMEITNVDEMLDQIHLQKEHVITYNRASKMHQIIKNFNSELRNMYDNYVCFYGDRDLAQMNRFLESAYKRSKEGWKNSNLASTRMSAGILLSAKNKLFQLYNQYNDQITGREKQQILKITEELKRQYKDTLKSHIIKMNGQYTQRDFEAMHGRMIAQSIGVVRKTLNYGGKLNNLVGEELKRMEAALNDHFEKRMATINFLPEQQSSSSPSPNQQDCQDPVQLYDMAIRKEIKALYAMLEPIKLKEKHDKIIEQVTEGLDGLEKEELTTLLDTHWLDMVEQHEEKMSLISGQHFSSGQIGLYLTRKWVWVVAHTVKEGNLRISFPGGEDVETGFPALVASSRGESRWGYSAKKLMDQMGYDLDHRGNLFHYITNGINNGGVAQEMTSRLIHGAKAGVEAATKQEISQVLVVIPSWFTFPERYRLRESCKRVGFKKVVMLTESSLAAFRLFSLLPSPTPPQDKGQDSLVLVVIALLDGIRLEIFGCESDQTNGVQLLAVVFQRWPPRDHRASRSSATKLPAGYVETVRATYARAIGQLEKNRRNSVRRYVVIPDYPEWIISLDNYFRDVENLTKAESISGKSFLRVFSKFANEPWKLGTFLDILTTTVPSGMAYFKQHTKQAEVAGEKNKENETNEKRKQSLLGKCERMEKQIKDGSVKVGQLTRKIIMESIRLALEAASENVFDGEEASDIHDLYRMHNFK